MKVALYCSRFPLLSETFVVNHVVRLMERGVDVSVVAQDEGDAWGNVPEALRETIRSRMVLIPPGWRTALGALPRLGPLRRQIAGVLSGTRRQAGRYDVILAHFGPAGVKAMALRDKGRIEGAIATVFHGFDMSVVNVVAANLPGYRQLFEKTEALLPISRLWAGRLEEWGADPDKIRVLHMGVDMPDHLPARDSVATPLRVLQVGRLVEKKGGGYSVEGVLGCTAPVRFDMIGGGPCEQQWRDQVAAAGAGERIRFHGPQPHAAVLAALDQADVFLLPSVTAEGGDMEGIPVALMEAMLRGCVVVSTFHSGIPELIDDGVSGFLVPERSGEAIAHVLDAIAQGRHDLAAIRRNAVAKIEQEFNNDRLTDDLLDILARVANGQPLHDGEKTAVPRPAPVDRLADSR